MITLPPIFVIMQSRHPRTAITYAATTADRGRVGGPVAEDKQSPRPQRRAEDTAARPETAA